MAAREFTSERTRTAALGASWFFFSTPASRRTPAQFIEFERNWSQDFAIGYASTGVSGTSLLMDMGAWSTGC